VSSQSCGLFSAAFGTYIRWQVLRESTSGPSPLGSHATFALGLFSFLSQTKTEGCLPCTPPSAGNQHEAPPPLTPALVTRVPSKCADYFFFPFPFPPYGFNALPSIPSNPSDVPTFYLQRGTVKEYVSFSLPLSDHPSRGNTSDRTSTAIPSVNGGQKLKLHLDSLLSSSVVRRDVRHLPPRPCFFFFPPRFCPLRLDPAVQPVFLAFPPP